MGGSKADIIAQLQRDILCLQGFRSTAKSSAVDLGLGPIKHAFPNATFPTDAIHEFHSAAAEHAAATAGFISSLLGRLMQHAGACVWISTARSLFPPALKFFGIEPDQVIFVTMEREKDVLWAMEEALKCKGLAAVVAEIKELSFMASRRLQLAVEQSCVTGFIIRHQPRYIGVTACVSRWQIKPLPSQLEEGMPGVGFPRWQVELLKIRNGQPGVWQVEWSAGRCRPVGEPVIVKQQPERKTG
jgi:protein ImuA